ncbi:hypothetical protein [Nocardia vaccinii]|nr:hypothetical protein [Nocardia vaccinii]
MTYTDRQYRHIVVFAIVAAVLAVLISGTTVTAVLCMHSGHHAPVPAR